MSGVPLDATKPSYGFWFLITNITIIIQISFNVNKTKIFKISRKCLHDRSVVLLQIFNSQQNRKGSLAYFCKKIFLLFFVKLPVLSIQTPNKNLPYYNHSCLDSAVTGQRSLSNFNKKKKKPQHEVNFCDDITNMSLYFVNVFCDDITNNTYIL